jgi:3-phenylpropionate/cinnamic acid dioxygenase small subunit
MGDRTADRLDIAETLSRYGWAMHDRDWDAWKAVFAPGAKVDYSTAGGIVGSPDEAAEWLGNTFAMFEVAISHGGNVVIDFTGDDTATVRSIYKMVMKIGGDTPTFMEACGYYNDQFVRHDGAWKIADRFEQILYMK